MHITEALGRMERIRIPGETEEVVRTVAAELADRFDAVTEEGVSEVAPGVFRTAVVTPSMLRDLAGKEDDNAVYFQLKEDGSGVLAATKPHLLYSSLCYVIEVLSDRPVEEYADGKLLSPSFKWQRISYDFFLTQAGRIQKGLNRESYIRELARLGFTHIEVNGLAFPMGIETGPKGETYPMFYTYCPALDQFVSSTLNKGIYPHYYLSANLAYLKENAALARKYGLVPGLLSFEPRSVPEEFFARYPMLRGARVDHPLRSFKPRYNMTIVHPRVREHYAEMMENLMREVPDLGFFCIWTNDSGAGFEHTKSLYVGRNGGAYLIREWKDDAEIARVAGENALRFFRVLRDAGRSHNPEFRLLTRLESFYGEHETIWKGLGDGLDVETTSLVARGWDMPYTHPNYPDSKAINGGTAQHQGFDEKESVLAEELRKRDGNAHFYFSMGPHIFLEPLLGIPYPWLTHQRIKTLRDSGIDHLAHCGGTCPPELAPYNVNHEVTRRFAFDAKMDIDAEVENIAKKWVGEEHHRVLVEAWKRVEEAILAYPNVTPLYSAFGFTWYRLWVRPLVPNIEALSNAERAFYEDFMCTTPHNPNNVDLSRDVLFQLTTLEKSRTDLERFKLVWPPLDEAIAKLDTVEGAVFHDQLVRLRALRCWLMTQRNVAAWIAGVHGYLEAATGEERQGCKDLLQDMTEKEIDNARRLKELLDSGVEFMATTNQGENPLIHGRNLKELIERRVEIMKRHAADEPFIDPDYLEREAARFIE